MQTRANLKWHDWRSMTDQQFLKAAQEVFDAVESGLDRTGLDLDTVRSGNVLTIEFDDGGKVVINSQEPLHEMWLAAKSGGFHYRLSTDADSPGWRDTRSGEEFFTVLSRVVSAQSGQAVLLRKSDP